MVEKRKWDPHASFCWETENQNIFEIGNHKTIQDPLSPNPFNHFQGPNEVISTTTTAVRIAMTRLRREFGLFQHRPQLLCFAKSVVYRCQGSDSYWVSAHPKMKMALSENWLFPDYLEVNFLFSDTYDCNILWQTLQWLKISCRERWPYIFFQVTIYGWTYPDDLITSPHITVILNRKTADMHCTPLLIIETHVTFMNPNMFVYNHLGVVYQWWILVQTQFPNRSWDVGPVLGFFMMVPENQCLSPQF